MEFDTEALCNELSQLIERGPGANPVALGRASDIIGLLEDSANKKHRERLRHLFFHFEEWFHDARWRQYGEVGGRLRSYLHWEIAAVRRDLADRTPRI
jgi:hypothetical protein